LRNLRDALEFRWTKRGYHRCYPREEGADSFEKGLGYDVSRGIDRAEALAKVSLRLLSGLGDAPEGNPNRCPVTGERYSLPVEVRQAFTKVESPTPDVARVLEEIERRFGVAVDQVQLPEDWVEFNRNPDLRNCSRFELPRTDRTEDGFIQQGTSGALRH